jgi:hypothetical protein
MINSEFKYKFIDKGFNYLFEIFMYYICSLFKFNPHQIFSIQKILLKF